MTQTRQVVRAIKQSILLRCLWFTEWLKMPGSRRSSNRAFNFQMKWFKCQTAQIRQKKSLRSVKKVVPCKSVAKYSANRTARIRHRCRKTTVLSCHRCLINTGVKKWTTFEYRLKLLPTGVSKYENMLVFKQLFTFFNTRCSSISAIRKVHEML
jgi:hypothetical protein